MKPNDIITIMQTDERAQKSIRMLKVVEVSARPDGKLRVEGTNLQGGNYSAFALPTEKHTGEIPREPNFIGWFPFQIRRGDV